MKISAVISFIILLAFTGITVADWSIAEPTEGNAAYIKSIEAQGYWNFEWDPTNPISAAMYCCQWEMVHGANMKYWNALSNSSSSSSSSSGSSSSVETESYCPACAIDEDFAELEEYPSAQSLSDELMDTKPWLKETKNSNTGSKNETNTSIMSFSDPVKI